MSMDTKTILEQYTQTVKAIYGDSLKNVILYGSYARGDFRQDSDIDIMILVSMDDEEIRGTMKQVYDDAYDFWWDYDVDINPIVKNETHFRNWVDNYPFYKNVLKEGISLYAA